MKLLGLGRVLLFKVLWFAVIGL